MKKKCSWQWEHEQQKKMRKGRKEGKKREDLFRMGVEDNGSLNSTERRKELGKERKGRNCSGWVCLVSGA